MTDPSYFQQIVIQTAPHIGNTGINDEDYESVMRSHCEMIYKRYGFDLNATRKALGYGNVTQMREKFRKWGILIDK